MSTEFQIGQLSGQTTGILTGRDYGTDLQAIKVSLDTLATNVNLLTGAITKLDTNLTGGVPDPTGSSIGVLQALFGPIAATQQGAGTIPFNTGASAMHLQNIQNHLDRLADNTGAVGAAITEKTQDFSQIASQLAIFNASAQIFIAQSARKQAFEVAATNAALERAGLPEVEPTQASVDETMTTAVTDAVTVGTQARVGGFVTEQISNATSYATDLATDYIQSTGLGVFVTEKFASLRATFQVRDPEGGTDKSGEIPANTKSNTIPV